MGELRPPNTQAAPSNRARFLFPTAVSYGPIEMPMKPGKPAKNADTAIDADALIGEVAIVRSAIWLNGNRKVAAIITEATTDPVFLPERAIALVSLSAFAPNAPSRMMRDIPLYAMAQDEKFLPCAWLKNPT